MLNSAARDAQCSSQGTSLKQACIHGPAIDSATPCTRDVSDVLLPALCLEADSDSGDKPADDDPNGIHLPRAPQTCPNVRTPTEWDSAVHFPLWITQTERALVAPLVPSWTEQFISTCGGTSPEFLIDLSKPLRPLWLSQSSLIWTNQIAPPQSLPFIPIYLVSASLPLLYHRRVTSIPRGIRQEADAETAEDAEPETISYVYVPTSQPRHCSG